MPFSWRAFKLESFFSVKINGEPQNIFNFLHVMLAPEVSGEVTPKPTILAILIASDYSNMQLMAVPKSPQKHNKRKKHHIFKC